MPRLSLSVLGCFQADLEGNPITDFESNKARALLTYLVAESDRPHRRDELSYLFWTDYPEAQAMKNLRQALYRLRRTLSGGLEEAENILVVTPQDIRLDPDWDCESDLKNFRLLLAEVEQHNHRRIESCPICIQKLEQAIELYRGDLLTGLSLRGSPAFEDWLQAQREQLRDQALRALRSLAGAAKRRGQYETACRYARRQIELLPTHEEAYRQLMRSLALDGRRSEALAQYKALKRTLRSELGIEPAEETTALYTQIVQELPLSTPSDALLRKFPMLLTPFIGREAELAKMMELLAASDCRLLTLYGPGGVGKTRLAIEAAARIGPMFENGAGFVALQPVESVEEVVIEIADVLGFSLQSTLPLRKQLLNRLAEAGELLLVLDNCEHLSLAGLAQDMLQAAPHLTILATSRTRLNLQAEWLLPVRGLSCPDPATTEQGDGAAVRLFTQRARQAQWELENAPEVAHICRLVEGLPLGIELAAAWVGKISLAQIAAEIEHNLDFLASSYPDVPDRHRSLRAVFEHSWKLLSEEERLVLMQVSVFRGGFQIAATRQVAGAETDVLASLLCKSLVFLEGGECRYQLHATIRRYAEEKLEEQSVLAQQTRSRHAVYFADYMHQREASLRGSQQMRVQVEIGDEMQNVYAAWQWAISQSDQALLSRLMHGLYLYYEARSWFDEGGRVFQQAVDKVKTLTGDDSASKTLLARLLARQAVFFRQLSQYGKAAELIEEGLALLAAASLDNERAFLLYQSAWIAFLQAKYARAKQLVEESLKIYRAIGDPIGVGDALYVLGWTNYELGLFSDAEALCREGIAICEKVDYTWGVHYSLYGLGLVMRAQGFYAESKRCFLQTLEFCEAVDFLWGAALARINLGQLALISGDLQEARCLYEKGLQTCERINNLWGVAQSYKGLGGVALEQRDFAAAQEYAQRSWMLYQRMQDRDGMADCLLILCQAAYESGDSASAWRYLDRAEELIRATGNGFREANALVQRAILLSLGEKNAEAEEILLKAIRHPACERHTYHRAVAALRELQRS